MEMRKGIISPRKRPPQPAIEDEEEDQCIVPHQPLSPQWGPAAMTIEDDGVSNHTSQT